MGFNKYFQDELNYLREMGAEFAAAYPALAPMLADRGGDPDVERLLEGFAFLTGRIREKLDDELPELMLTVSQLLFPQLVRPLPAASILEFLPVQSALKEKRAVPAGTEVQSIAVDGTRCRFRTTAEVTLAPLALTRVALTDLAAGKQELRIELDLLQKGEPHRLLPDDLVLHFPGENQEALSLLAHVLLNASDVVVSNPDGPPNARAALPKGCLKQLGFEEHEALLPQVKGSFVGFRLLQEYYVLPSKFAFLSLTGFGPAAASLGNASRIVIAIQLKSRTPSTRSLTTETLKLHSVPIVNVFETTAEPIRISPGRQHYVVRPAGLSHGHGEVYSIEDVQTVERGGRRVNIPPFLSFEHAALLEGAGRVFFSEHRRSRVVGEGVETLISLGTAEDSGVVPEVETLSIGLLATNGPLANAIRVGEISEAAPGSPPFTKFRNLRAVTHYIPPLLGFDLQWRAIAHVALNVRALTEPEVLRTVLGVYNLHAVFDRQAARANELRIKALRSLEVRPAEKLFRGAAIRGIDIQAELDETGFSGEGDLYLFGSVLERLFAEYVSINSFSRLRVRGVGTNAEYQWAARSGSQTLV